MKNFPCVESTADLDIGDRIIRLWINETEVKDFYADNEGIIKNLRNFLREWRANTEIVEFICTNVPRANAVQIKDKEGVDQQGVVAYLVSFADDNIHG